MHDHQRFWDDKVMTMKREIKAYYGNEVPQEKVCVFLEKWFCNLILEYLRDFTKSFWERFFELSKSVGECDAVVSLVLELKQIGTSLEMAEESLLKDVDCNIHIVDNCYMVMAICSTLLCSIPPVFCNSMLLLCCKAFAAYDLKHKMEANDDSCDLDLLTCSACLCDKDSCKCSLILSQFATVKDILRDMNLLDRLAEDAVFTVIHERLVSEVEFTCKGNFEESYLTSLEKWFEATVVGWLHSIFVNNQAVLHKHCQRLLYDMHEIYTIVRIDQLFSIVIEYPDSQPAILDLRKCMEKTNLRPRLAKSLKEAFERRLLHPGVNTSDILTAYISAIRALRALDPSGVLLDLVCDPVKLYLRGREDTVRCIILNLTDDSSNELSDELVKRQGLVLDDSTCDDDGSNWDEWVPDPVDANPTTLSFQRRNADIISMLVNIYGSRDLFVREYQTLLADRILSRFNYRTERELRYLELLKLRFGENQLHYCEVMLKDVADSRRLNTNITESRRKSSAIDDEEVPVKAMIISSQFWPVVREEKIKLPEFMLSALKSYTKDFEALKGNRTLKWKYHLGLVDLDIETDNRTLQLKVSPIHATIIHHFEKKECWKLEDLASEMQITPAVLRRKISFWQTKRLLKETGNDCYSLVEESALKTVEDGNVFEDEAESAMASAKDQKAEEFTLVWQYIVGMLTNLESLPIERMHAMLKMFAMSGPGCECSVNDLQALLEAKVREQKLVFHSGVYRLPKSDS